MDTSIWWWIVAGVMLAAEIMTGTFYLLVLALAAGLAAVAAHLGLDAWGQVMVAASITALGSFAVQAWHKKHGNKDNPTQNLDVGQSVSVESWLDARTARVRYRGSMWTATLAEGAPHD
ncbi:MAG: hypothetical protein RLZZ502_832, partial [Pseudomonadota bacterium]